MAHMRTRFPSYTVISPPPIYLAVASKSGNLSDIRVFIPQNVTLQWASTTGTHLTNVPLVGGCLIGVHVMGVNLMGGCFMGVYLIGGRLMGVHLTGVHLRACISRACTS